MKTYRFIVVIAAASVTIAFLQKLPEITRATCVPGKQEHCLCLEPKYVDRTSYQTCAPDGKSYGACCAESAR